MSHKTDAPARGTWKMFLLHVKNILSARAKYSCCTWSSRLRDFPKVIFILCFLNLWVFPGTRKRRNWFQKIVLYSVLNWDSKMCKRKRYMLSIFSSWKRERKTELAFHTRFNEDKRLHMKSVPFSKGESFTTRRQLLVYRRASTWPLWHHVKVKDFPSMHCDST